MVRVASHVYRVFKLGIIPSESECWAITKANIYQIDAVDQWHDFVRNADIHHITN